jgi:hypothetical protein
MNIRTAKRRSLLVLAAVGLTILSTGCGEKSDSGGVASLGETTTTAAKSSNTADPAAYSDCMRKNGVAGFPDPDAQGRLMLKAGPGSGIDPESATFKAAEETCKSLAPTQGAGGDKQAANQDMALRYSQCMRDNGIPNFPDPQMSGGKTRMSLPQGVDPSSPAFKSAQEKCGTLMSGPSTAAANR